MNRCSFLLEEMFSGRKKAQELDCIDVPPALQLGSVTGKLPRQGTLKHSSLGHPCPYGSQQFTACTVPCLGSWEAGSSWKVAPPTDGLGKVPAPEECHPAPANQLTGRRGTLPIVVNLPVLPHRRTAPFLALLWAYLDKCRGGARGALGYDSKALGGLLQGHGSLSCHVLLQISCASRGSQHNWEVGLGIASTLPLLSPLLS